MKFREYLNESDNTLTEGKEEAQAIRNILKKEFGLSSRDVSVKNQNGGLSSAVNVKIKSMKALPYYKKIKNIGEDFQSYDTDEYTGEILSGGNTYVFVELDSKFSDSIKEIINKEFNKQSKGSFEEGDEVTLFKTFNVYYMDDNTFVISVKNGGRTNSVMYKEAIAAGVLSLIEMLDEPELYTKIK